MKNKKLKIFNYLIYKMADPCDLITYMFNSYRRHSQTGNAFQNTFILVNPLHFP